MTAATVLPAEPCNLLPDYRWFEILRAAYQQVPSRDSDAEALDAIVQLTRKAPSADCVRYLVLAQSILAEAPESFRSRHNGSTDAATAAVIHGLINRREVEAWVFDARPWWDDLLAKLRQTPGDSWQELLQHLGVLSDVASRCAVAITRDDSPHFDGFCRVIRYVTAQARASFALDPGSDVITVGRYLTAIWGHLMRDLPSEHGGQALTQRSTLERLARTAGELIPLLESRMLGARSFHDWQEGVSILVKNLPTKQWPNEVRMAFHLIGNFLMRCRTNPGLFNADSKKINIICGNLFPRMRNHGREPAADDTRGDRRVLVPESRQCKLVFDHEGQDIVVQASLEDVCPKRYLGLRVESHEVRIAQFTGSVHGQNASLIDGRFPTCQVELSLPRHNLVLHTDHVRLTGLRYVQDEQEYELPPTKCGILRGWPVPGSERSGIVIVASEACLDDPAFEPWKRHVAVAERHNP